MSTAIVRAVCSFALLTAHAAPSAAQSWKLQYSYDRVKDSLSIVDLKFTSARHGVAVGVILETVKNSFYSKPARNVALITADGGATWSETELKEMPVSLFFLNDGRGWLVTSKGIWTSAEGGRDWTKLPRTKFTIGKVYFADERHGWGVGPKRTAVETHDGGRTWKAIGEGPGSSRARFGTLDSIVFLNPQDGVIIGWVEHPGLSRDPLRPKELSGLYNTMLVLETHDGGMSWNAGSKSMNGAMTRIHFAGAGKGLGLVEGAGTSPTAVFQLPWPQAGGKLIFQDKTIYVTDVWAGADGANHVAGIAGGATVAAPRRVKAFKSADGMRWTPVPVDYRAVASRVILAGAENNLWMATDTGMILKLVN